jgi:DnaK suppressor protein
MARDTENQASQRLKILRNLLTHLREKELARARKLRADEAGDAVTEPSDSLEVARGSEELELHADLAARAEDRLNDIHAALERLDEGTYGICGKCHREIDLARLRAVPFAPLCADCQKARPAGREEGVASDEFLNRWSVPEGMVETLGGAEPLELPEGNASELAGETFVPAPRARPAPAKRPPKKPRGRKV